MSNSIDAQELRLAAIRIALESLAKGNKEYPKNNLGAGRELAEANIEIIDYILKELMVEDLEREDLERYVGCNEEESE